MTVMFGVRALMIVNDTLGPSSSTRTGTSVTVLTGTRTAVV